jgi:hypothetical protein
MVLMERQTEDGIGWDNNENSKLSDLVKMLYGNWNSIRCVFFIDVWS